MDDIDSACDRYEEVENMKKYSGHNDDFEPREVIDQRRWDNSPSAIH